MDNWRKHILFSCIIAMMIALFISRSVLSISIIVFVTVCFLHTNLGRQFKNFFASPLLWGMSLLFLVPLVSGLWSMDKDLWMDIMRIKLPLLLMPLAFAFSFDFSIKQCHILGFIFILLITGGTLWSMYHYVNNMQAVHESYLHAKTLITPLENDHVRFSWLIAIAILFGGWLWLRYRHEKKIAWPLSFIILWLIVFLHILAARTGLISFYIITIATIVWIIFNKLKLWMGLSLFVLIIALPIGAYYFLPTFHNKIRYFKYDYEYFKDAHYLPGGNDASRVISIKAGRDIMKDQAEKGVGFGDITSETEKWYQINYPEVAPNDIILPSSEWLIYGDGCGIPGFIIFSYVMLIPFFIRIQNRARWWLLNSIVAFGFLFDIGLEIQFGVFIYSLIVLFTWKWFHYESRKN